MPDNGKQPFAADYVTVAERIDAFIKKYPDGSLQSRIIELSESRVVMEAQAYRTPDDARPGIGYSSLEIPGRTPYTRGSEIENCETSAWGRAIAALGFEVKHGVATSDEIANKRDDGQPRLQVVSQTPNVPEEPPGLMEAPPRHTASDVEDDAVCAEHGIPWLGAHGDRYHKKPEGGYCRTAPGNVAKARR